MKLQSKLIESKLHKNKAYHFAVKQTESGNLLQAIKSYRGLLAQFPNSPTLLSDLGTLELRLGNLAEAIRLYQTSIGISQNQYQAHNNLAIALASSKRPDEALLVIEKALVLMPKSSIAHYTKGKILLDLNQLDSAIDSFAYAITIKADFPEAFMMQGDIFRHMRRLDEALHAYDIALRIRPDYASAHWNRSYVHLMKGNYALGFKEFEWRKMAPEYRRLGNLGSPEWLGEEDNPEHSILICPEIGFGDFIQFARYIPLLGDRFKKVIVKAPRSLANLIACMRGNHETIAEGEAIPEHDVHCSIMSLPLAFHTDIDSIPAEFPYLRPDAATCAQWKDLLGPHLKPRVGVFWSTPQRDDADATIYTNRSIPTAALNAFLELPFDFHSLQKEYPNSHADDLRGLSLHRHDERLHSFSDTAALINEMDLVISIDSAAAHLAGAMGISLWVMLPYTPDYRWMTETTNSPWYPQARLFRQAEPGDWKSLMREIARNLECHFAKPLENSSNHG